MWYARLMNWTLVLSAGLMIGTPLGAVLLANLAFVIERRLKRK